LESEWYLLNFASIFVLGIGAQWLAWRIRLPAILILLLFGIAAGPGTAWLEAQGYLSHRFLDPDLALGSLLLPVVSVSVSIILFEGGLTLSRAEFTQAGRTIFKLVSVGAGVTWLASTLAAWLVLDASLQLSLLLGAVLVVTGPTVIGPLLRHVRPTGRVGPILKWEGIVIDPIGALLAVVVFEAIPTGRFQDWAAVMGGNLTRTLLAGGTFGLGAAILLVVVLSRHRVPDFLQSPVTLMLVVASFAGSNLVHSESGLFAVTLMGIVLANQKYVSVRHILEFKENLTVLLISALFVLLGARLRLDELARLDWRVLAFIGILIVIVRPLAVMASTSGEGLNWRERVFLMCMAPRGIVAAAVASVFALRLQMAEYPDWDLLVPYTFAVIIGTVGFYGLIAGWAARKLGLANTGRRGLLIAGANPIARAVAAAVHKEGYAVLLVDTNLANLSAARLAGLPTFFGSILSQHVVERIELSGIGRLLALTPNDEINSLAALQFARLFGRSQVYQVASEGSESSRTAKTSHELRGRLLFGSNVTYSHLERILEQGGSIRKTSLTREFDYKKLVASRGEGFTPLFVIDETGQLVVATADATLAPRPGQTVIAISPRREAGEPAAGAGVAPGESS
jgi:NhaP-type Na+/H+ or K+/H+ antiporter